MVQLAKTDKDRSYSQCGQKKEGKKEMRNQKQEVVAQSVATNGSRDSRRLKKDKNLENNSLNRGVYF